MHVFRLQGENSQGQRGDVSKYKITKKQTHIQACMSKALCSI